MNQEARKTEYEAAFEQGTVSQSIHEIGSTHFALLPPDYTAEDLHSEKFQPAPNRIRADVKIDDEASFIAYVTNFKMPGTTLFANREASTITALLDYHQDTNLPSWCTHKATFTARKSEEWKTWIGKNKQSIPQRDFAEFLEDNILDVADPPGAVMLEAAMNLQAEKTVHFKSAVNLANGTTQLEFVENLDGAGGVGQLTFPTKFTLGITPYVGGRLISVPVRLRYRIADTKLTFIYIIERDKKILETAFDGILQAVGEATGYQPLAGAAL